MALSKILPASQDQYVGARNLIINGNMAVAQRGTQTSITSAYTACDRWNFTRSGAAVVDASQSTDVPSGEGFANSLKIDVTTADTSVAAGDFAHLRTRFEGQDLQQLRKGTSEAKSLTLSFWVKSAKTGTHIVELYDLDNARQVSKSYSITTADTWQNVTLQFPADTTGAFGNDNDASLQVAWWLLAGSTYSGGTLNTSWASSTNANRVAGQVNVMDDAANNFYLTGVQLEVGETATPFEHESYAETLRKCHRYYIQGTNIGSFYPVGNGVPSSATSFRGFIPTTVEMRTVNTFGNLTGARGNATTRTLSSHNLQEVTALGVGFGATSSSLAASQAYVLVNSASDGSEFYLDGEL